MKDKNFINKWSRPVAIRLGNDRRAKQQGVQTLGQLISFVETPLGNQIQALRPFMKWIFVRYATQGILRFEDIQARAIPALRKFARPKAKKVLQQNNIELNLERYKTLPDLERVIEPFEKQVQSSDAELERELIDKKEALVLYDDANYKIVSPRTERASCYFGRNTKWCTAGKHGSEFEYYNSMGPLFIFLDKRKNKRWQLHWNLEHTHIWQDDYYDDDEDIEEFFQFMDEEDRPVSIKDIPAFLKRYPVLPRVFNKPQYFPIFKPKTRKDLETVIRNHRWAIMLFKNLPKQIQMDLFDYGDRLSRNPKPERMKERGVPEREITKITDFDKRQALTLDDQKRLIKNATGRNRDIFKNIELDPQVQLDFLKRGISNYRFIKNPTMQTKKQALKELLKSIEKGGYIPAWAPSSLIKLVIRKSSAALHGILLTAIPARDQVQYLPRFIAWLDTKRNNKTGSFIRDLDKSIEIRERDESIKNYPLAPEIRMVFLKWLIKQNKIRPNLNTFNSIWPNRTAEEKELMAVLRSKRKLAHYNKTGEVLGDSQQPKKFRSTPAQRRWYGAE